ncbi:Zinc transporter [Quaeritorhiza haematococci]|nr:Zinc transporter [Quaeritorhiza haematococci]
MNGSFAQRVVMAAGFVLLANTVARAQVAPAAPAMTNFPMDFPVVNMPSAGRPPAVVVPPGNPSITNAIPPPRFTSTTRAFTPTATLRAATTRVTTSTTASAASATPSPDTKVKQESTTPPNTSAQSETKDAQHSKTESKELNQANVPLAFGLVTIAVLAVAIGATIPFLDRFGLIDASSPTFLAGALALASGVVIFLALDDLLPSAADELKNSKVIPEKLATPITLLVFLGSLFGIFLAKRIGGIFKKHSDQTDFVVSDRARHSLLIEKGGGFEDTEKLIGFSEKEKKDLEKNTFSMVIALAVHNIPEGLSILAVTLADARLGILLTIGLVFHKIPEGIIVALPMYIATGNPWRGMAMAMLASGVSTFLGAVLGYLFFLRFWNPAISGFILAFVAGIMLYVALHGMLPTAHKHDPKDKVCSLLFVVGIAILAGAGIIMELVGGEGEA